MYGFIRFTEGARLDQVKFVNIDWRIVRPQTNELRFSGPINHKNTWNDKYYIPCPLEPGTCMSVTIEL